MPEFEGEKSGVSGAAYASGAVLLPDEAAIVAALSPPLAASVAERVEAALAKSMAGAAAQAAREALEQVLEPLLNGSVLQEMLERLLDAQVAKLEQRLLASVHASGAAVTESVVPSPGGEFDGSAICSSFVDEAKLPRSMGSPEPSFTALHGLQDESRASDFRIFIDKRRSNGGAKIGLDVSGQAGTADLRVDAVSSSGLVGEWNQANPDLKVMPGDCLVEINGVRGSSTALREVILRDTTLDILITPAQAPAMLPQWPPSRDSERSPSGLRIRQNTSDAFAAGATRQEDYPLFVWGTPRPAPEPSSNAADPDNDGDHPMPGFGDNWSLPPDGPGRSQPLDPWQFLSEPALPAERELSDPLATGPTMARSRSESDLPKDLGQLGFQTLGVRRFLEPW